MRKKYQTYLIERVRLGGTIMHILVPGEICNTELEAVEYINYQCRVHRTKQYTYLPVYGEDIG